MKWLIVIGSLRKASFSRRLGQVVSQFAPEGCECEIIDGRDLPLFDQDLDGDVKPEPVAKMLDQVKEADGLIFITPEFNYGIPGPLKNLIDWASRPAFKSPLKNSPSLVIALSPAPSGGARVHAQLTAVLAGTLAPTYLAPSFLVPAVHEKWDDSGALADEVTKTRLSRTLDAFAAWVSQPQATSF